MVKKHKIHMKLKIKAPIYFGAFYDIIFYENLKRYLKEYKGHKD